MTPSALWTGFLLLLVLSPLPLGSNRPLSWSVLGLAAGLLLLGWSWQVHQRQIRVFWRPALWPPFALLVLVLIWIVLQTGLVAIAGGNPLWEMADATLGKDLRTAIGLAPDAALVGLFKLLTYATVFWLALQMGRDPERAWQLVRWFVWASAAYAGYGLINYFAGNHWLLWYDRWAYKGDVTSTFVNRNHYATYAALGVLAATALAIKTFKAKWRVGDRSLGPLNRVVDALLGMPLAYIIVVLLVGMAWLQTHSRLGFAAGAFGIAMFLVLLRTGHVIRGRWSFLLLSAFAASFLVTVSGGRTLARLSGTQEFDRAPLFALVADSIGQSPIVGYGYGSFPAAFQMFRDTSFPPKMEYTEAHSVYLELAFELGVPASVVAIAAIVWLAVISLYGAYSRRRDAIAPALSFSAVIVVGIHSIADFSLQIPALAFAFAAILGVGTAQSWSVHPKG